MSYKMLVKRANNIIVLFLNELHSNDKGMEFPHFFM